MVPPRSIVQPQDLVVGYGFGAAHLNLRQSPEHNRKRGVAVRTKKAGILHEAGGIPPVSALDRAAAPTHVAELSAVLRAD